MEITKLTQVKKQNLFVFLIKDLGFKKTNILRRYIMDFVPTMAMETINLRKNSSVLYDETVAHRLGLVVLKTDLKSYNIPQECTCGGEGCAKCSLDLTLSEKGPKIVYASDIKSKDKKVVPVYPTTPIAKLLEGQELEFEAKAVLGRGREHAKWSPAHAYYRGYPVPELQEGADVEAIAKAFPKAFTATKNSLKVADPLLITDSVIEFCEDHKVKINQSGDEIIFYIEPFGQLGVKEIMTEAINQFNKQLNDFSKLL